MEDEKRMQKNISENLDFGLIKQPQLTTYSLTKKSYVLLYKTIFVF